MTDREYIKLANEMLSYNSKITDEVRRNFIKQISTKPRALAEARRLYSTGDSLYQTNYNKLTELVSKWFFLRG